jgi:hypothetical protein
MCGLLCSEKTIAPLYIVWKMRLRLEVIMILVGWAANADRPPIGFCMDWLLGSKYIVCQEILN